MENEEKLEQTNEQVLDTTNTEEVAEGTEQVNNQEVENVNESVQETAKSLRELLKENPELQEQFNTMTENRLKRQKREFENKYSRVETVLNAGLGTSNIEEATDKLTDFYKERGIDIPTQPQVTEEDFEALGEQDARKFISTYDFEEVVDEVDRLANIGVENMTPRELTSFKTLAEYRNIEGKKRELSSIGVREDLLNSEDFKTFASKFNESTPVKDVYELYEKTQPKPKVEPIGSMKTEVKPVKKDYYTPEELNKLTMEDLNDPEVMKAAEYSMQQHYLQNHRK